MWQILNDRNSTSHIYEEALAEAIGARIAHTHYAALRIWQMVCKSSARGMISGDKA